MSQVVVSAPPSVPRDLNGRSDRAAPLSNYAVNVFLDLRETTSHRSCLSARGCRLDWTAERALCACVAKARDLGRDPSAYAICSSHPGPEGSVEVVYKA